jgi:C_GCAxxG_C_C family probable redox protein
MSKSGKATEAMASGYNCAQAVATTYGAAFGVPEETLARIATGFGGGVSRSDSMCGGVTGALMVLGLKFGPKNQSEGDAKAKASAFCNEFIREFTRRHGAVSCTALLGYNLSVPEERKEASEKRVYATVCVEVVRNAGMLLEEFLARE